MTMYNHAFDLYHCIYRIIHILMRLEENDILELDRLRIWDFYLLFPSKVYEIRLGNDLKEDIHCTGFWFPLWFLRIVAFRNHSGTIGTRI